MDWNYNTKQLKKCSQIKYLRSWWPKHHFKTVAWLTSVTLLFNNLEIWFEVWLVTNLSYSSETIEFQRASLFRMTDRKQKVRIFDANLISANSNIIFKSQDWFLLQQFKLLARAYFFFQKYTFRTKNWISKTPVNWNTKCEFQYDIDEIFLTKNVR